MGFLDKVFRRGDKDDDTPVPEKLLESPERRAQLVELEQALHELVTAMRGDDCPNENPGWRGRVRDYEYSLGGVQLMLGGRITKEAIFDTVSTIRPLNEVPPGCDHLEELSRRVVALARAAEEPLPGE